MPPIIWRCFAPVSDPGNHGSDPSKCLQVAPFRTEGSSVWIGYHNQPSRKYLGVFPSLDEVVDRCRRNFIAGGPNTSFPRFNTRVTDGSGNSIACPETYSRHVCCAACQNEGLSCEALTLQYIPVETGHSTSRTKNKIVYLVVYKFYMKGEQMVALLQHVASGKYCFQKTDGTLSKALSLDSKHDCRDHSQSLSPSESEEDSDSYSLTEFDCAEDETATDAHISPHLQSNQWHQLQEPMTNIVVPSLQPPPMPQELLARPRVRGRVVIDMTDDDELSPIKQEPSNHPQHMLAPMLYKTPSATPASTPSIAPSEDLSFSDRFGPDPLAEEYGRITTQMVQEYSMRVFALSEIQGLMQRMKQAVKAGDRPALCRAYGALQAFLITVE